MHELDRARQAADAMWRGDAASKALGMAVDIPAAGSAVATMTVRDDMVNGHSICHGGLVFAVADTAFAFACNGHGHAAVAASAQIEFLRPSRLGDTLQATAVEDYRGRKNGYYTVTVRNGGGDVVALFRGRSAKVAGAAASSSK